MGKGIEQNSFKKREFKNQNKSNDNNGSSKTFNKKPFNKSSNGNKGDFNNKSKFNKDNKFNKKPFNKDFSKDKNDQYQKKGFNKDGEKIVRRVIDGDTMELRRLYNKLMQKTDNNKTNIVETILTKIKNNFKEYAFKHDGCRILQGCIKYGNKQQRKNVISQIKETIYELATGKYSIYLAIKIWKFAEKDDQEDITKICINKLTNLCKSPSGEMFLNFMLLNSTKSVQDALINYYLKYKLKVNVEELKRIYEENKDLENKAMEIEENFNINNNLSKDNKMIIDEEQKEEGDAEEDKEEQIAGIDDTQAILVGKKQTYQHEDFNENFKTIIETILEKKMHGNYIFHASLNTIFEYLSLQTKHYMTEVFDDDFEIFLNSKPSIELAIKLYTVASAKTRKKILKKVFKEEWANTLLAFEFNVVLVCKILLTTDDTKLSTKQVLKPLIAYSNTVDFSILIKVVHGLINPSKIHPLLDYSTDISTKKDKNKIVEEILSSCKKQVLNLINVHVEKYFFDPEKKGLTAFLLDLLTFLKQTESQDVNNTNKKTNVVDADSEDEDKDMTNFLDKVLDTLLDYIKFDFNNENKILLDQKNYFIIVQILKRLRNSSTARGISHNNNNNNSTALINNTNSYCKSITRFFEGVSALVKTNIDKFLESKAIFVVLVIYEDPAFKSLLSTELHEKISKLEKIKLDNKLNESSAVSILLDQLKGKN